MSNGSGLHSQTQTSVTYNSRLRASPPPPATTNKSASENPVAAAAGVSASAAASVHHPKKSRRQKVAPVQLTCGQKARDWVCSLRFLLPLILTISIVVVTVVSWKLTYDASQKSIDLVTTNFGTVVLSQVTAQTKQQLLAGELITSINHGYIRDGVLDPFNRPNEMYHAFYDQIQQHVQAGTCSSVYITLKSAVAMGYAYYFPPGSAPFVAYWNGSLTGDGINTPNSEYFTDANGNPTVLSDVLGNYELSLSTLPWWPIVNHSDPTSVGWTEPYFYGEWFQTFSRVIQDSVGNIIGIANIDLNLGTIDAFTKGVAAASPGSEFFIVNAQSGALLGTSYPQFNLGGTVADRFFLFNETSTDLMKTIHEFILSATGRVVDATHPPESLYNDLPFLQGTISVNGLSQLVTIQPFRHSPEPTTRGGPNLGPDGRFLAKSFTPSQLAWSDDHNVEWVFIHVLDRSAIVKAINDSNITVLITVICIAVSLIIFMCGWGLYSMNLLLGLSSLLTSFANFEFSEHVSQGKLKSPSIFTELRIMQDSVLLMTRAFKTHLENQKKMFGNTSSSSSHGDKKSNGAKSLTVTASTTTISGGQSTGPIASGGSGGIGSYSNQVIRSPLPLPQHRSGSVGSPSPGSGTRATSGGVSGSPSSKPLHLLKVSRSPSPTDQPIAGTLALTAPVTPVPTTTPRDTANSIELSPIPPNESQPSEFVLTQLTSPMSSSSALSPIEIDPPPATPLAMDSSNPTEEGIHLFILPSPAPANI